MLITLLILIIWKRVLKVTKVLKALSLQTYRVTFYQIFKIMAKQKVNPVAIGLLSKNRGGAMRRPCFFVIFCFTLKA